MKTLAAALILCLASVPALAQPPSPPSGVLSALTGFGVQDPEFRSDKVGGTLTFKLPGKEYELKTYDKPCKGEIWGWGDTVGEIRSKEDAEDVFQGIVMYSAAAWTNEKYANWRMEEWKKNNKNVKEAARKERESKYGKKLFLEVTMDHEDTSFHYLHLFLQKGKHNTEVMLWCPETVWEDSQKKMMAVLDGAAYAEVGAAPGAGGGGKSYSNATLDVSFDVPDGFVTREKDLELGDPNGVFEMKKGDDVYAVLATIAGELDVKTWADATIKAFGDSMKNIKMLDSRTVGTCERRDFRADTGGVAVRFGMMFWANGAKKQANYFYIWTAEGNWDKHKDTAEKVLASLKPGGAAAGDKPAAGDPPAAGGSDIKVAATIEVPTYTVKGFGKGTTVTYKMNAAGNEMEQCWVLLDCREPEWWIVRADLVMGGNKIDGQPMKYVVKDKKSEGGAVEGEKPEIKEGDEEIEVPAGKFKCHWIEAKTSKFTSKTWTCADVPFGTVKMESEASGAKTTMILVKFEKK